MEEVADRDWGQTDQGRTICGYARRLAACQFHRELHNESPIDLGDLAEMFRGSLFRDF